MRDEFVDGRDVEGALADVAVEGADVSVTVGVEVMVGLTVKVGIGVFVESDG